MLFSFLAFYCRHCKIWRNFLVTSPLNPIFFLFYPPPLPPLKVVFFSCPPPPQIPPAPATWWKWTVPLWRFVVFSQLSFSFEYSLHSIKCSVLHTTAASKRSLNHFVKSSPWLFLKFASWARSPALTIINTVKQQQKNTSYNSKTNKLSVFTLLWA